MCNQLQIDHAWLDALIQGDEEAWTRLIDEYHPLLLALAFRVLGNWQNAEDVVQAVWISCRKAIIDKERDEVHYGYFATAVTLAALRLRQQISRRAGGQGDSLETVPDDSTEGAPPDQQAQRAERITAVREALSSLPPEQREIIELRDFEDRKWKPIANALGCTVHQVRHAHARARNALRVEIARRLGNDP